MKLRFRVWPHLLFTKRRPNLLFKCSAQKEYTCGITLWVAYRAIELMGSYGYAFDCNVEKYLRGVKNLQL